MKKQISLTLALALIASFSSCGQEITPTVDTADTAADTTQPVLTETQRLTADLPDSDFGGYEFRVLARYNAGDWGQYDIAVDELNGEVINDAVHKRNSIVEDKYNMKFVFEKANGYDVSGPTQKAILSGSDDYDIVMPSITDSGNMAQSGLFTPLQDLPYLDLDKPWYDQGCLDNLKINGKNYMLFSDVTVGDLDAIWVYYFNKQMIDDFKLEDPYELVLSGKWTLDKMLQMCKTVQSDTSGDGVQDDRDRWGLVGHDYVITSSYIGSGERIATLAKDGSISLTMNTERVNTLIDALIKLEPYWLRYSLTAKKYSAAKGYGFKDGVEPTARLETLLNMFANNQALFIGEVLYEITKMRDFNVDFGILPAPKLEESQENYYTAVNYIAAATCIPKTATDLERTSIILEAWAAESRYTVLPAYYEVAMKSKYTRDTVSSDMLDLIFSSKSYDIGICYNWGELSGRFCSLVYEGSTDFASMYAANKAAAEDQIAKFMAE